MVSSIIAAITTCRIGRCFLETRNKWKECYWYIKKYGLRAGFAGVIYSGLVIIAKEVAVDGVKCSGKCYLGAILGDISLTCISGGLSFLTNVTKIVKYSKATIQSM